jgi:hypothetical protein
MASVIRIKRSGITGSPSNLAQGELAYSFLPFDPAIGQGGDRLYIGTGTEINGEAANIEVVGGKYFTEKLDHTPGILTANSAIITDNNNRIDQIQIDNIVIDGNSISTAAANTNLIFSLGGGKNVDVSNSRIINLGTPTANTDAVTKQYVDSAIQVLEASSEFDYATDVGSGKLNLSTEIFSLLGGTGITTSANTATDTVTFTLDNTAVTPGSYGSSTEVPVITIDAQGRITLASSASISTDLAITADTGSDTISLLTDSLGFIGGTGVATSISNNAVTFTIGQDVATNATVTFESINANTLIANTSIEVGNILINGSTISASANNSLTLSATFVSVNDTLIRDVADPQTPGDAANKRYVDSVAQGLSILPAARVATTADLGATYADGPDPLNPGVGATLTIPAIATLNIDGVTNWSLGDNILVKDQTNLPENGSYVITQLGDATTDWILTRCDFCNEGDEIPGSFEFVTEGTVYASTGWVATTPSSNNGIVVGTDDIVWLQFSGAGTYIGGNGLDLTGNVFSVNVDNSSIEINADTLRVKAAGITNAMLANPTITIAAESGTADPVSLGETITFAAGEGIDTVVTDNQITISAEDASYTNKGVASFANTDFVVAAGAVSLNVNAIQDIVGSTIFGGRAITVTYDTANNVLEVIGDLATTSTVGVASFNSANFAVTDGDVTITALDGGTY